MPIDKDLLAALPKDRREWLEKLGVGGKLDVDGRIERAIGADVVKRRPEDQVTYDMDLKLKDGTFWPSEGTFAATGVNGTMHLSPTQLVVSEMRGRRGKGEVWGSGSVAWPTGTPRISLTAGARNLMLDAPLYKLLPEPKRLVLFDGGHFAPLEIAIPLVNGWLEETLGPVKRD